MGGAWSRTLVGSHVARRRSRVGLHATIPRAWGAACWGWSPDAGEIAPLGNVRVVTAAFLISARVIRPAAMASSAQARAAAWKARRQAARQNRCALPPDARGRNVRSHQEQESASLIAGRDSAAASGSLAMAVARDRQGSDGSRACRPPRRRSPARVSCHHPARWRARPDSPGRAGDRAC
jgi:hypothetical protein